MEEPSAATIETTTAVEPEGLPVQTNRGTVLVGPVKAGPGWRAIIALGRYAAALLPPVRQYLAEHPKGQREPVDLVLVALGPVLPLMERDPDHMFRLLSLFIGLEPEALQGLTLAEVISLWAAVVRANDLLAMLGRAEGAGQVAGAADGTGETA